MSIYFISRNGRDLWNPGTMTGRLFFDQCTSIARIIGVESGLGPITSDEVLVDDAAFVRFAALFGELLLTTDRKSGAYSLLTACYGVVGALAQKGGADPPTHPELIRLISYARHLLGA